VPHNALFYRQIVEASHDVVWTLDPRRMAFTYVSPSVERLLGWTAEEVVARPVSDVLRPEDFALIRDLVAQILNTPPTGALSQTREFDQPHRDGHLVPTEVVTTVLLDERGEVSAVLGVSREVTDRRRAQDALQRSEFWLRQSQRIARLGSYVFDIVADRWTSSETLDEIFGIGPDYVRSAEGWLGLVHPDERENLRIYLAKEILGRHRPFYLDYRIARANDLQVRWVQGRGELEFDAAGNPVRLIGTIQDVTDQYRQEEQRRELEARLLQAQKLESLGVLAGGVAHEFNNLLTSILGHSDLVLQDLPPDSPASQSVAAIGAAARRAAEISQRLLAYSGRGRFVVGPTSVPGLVRDMMRMLELTVSKRTTLRADLPDGLPFVDADADQLRQLVMNLVSNASEAMGDHAGAIKLTASVVESVPEAPITDYFGEPLERGRYVVLEVADSGAGFGPETKARLFDPFFSTKFTGRGLGLAAALGIVRGHRGAIQVESQPGRGTTFRVFLPALSQEPAVPAPAAATAPPPQAASATVLVVDDEPEVRTVALRMVERCGYRAVGAADGQEAVDLVRDAPGRFDCVLLDLTMPRLGGEDALREIRQLAPALPVLLCSGYPAQELTERFAGKGLSGFVQKPYRLGEIRSRLDAVFGRL
jgi:two-component system, cell cycle sensor histidine kinase and response regulator CckA